MMAFSLQNLISFLVLLCFAIYTVKSENASSILYVKSMSNSSNCPTTVVPCLTLNEFLKQRNDSFLTFIFLDGYHVLDTNFTMTDMVDVTLRADSNATVSIDCIGQAKVLFNNVSGLVIENIAFISCGISSPTNLPGISLYNLDQALLINITIMNSSAGALYIQESVICIVDILIEKNKAGGSDDSFVGLKAVFSTLYLYGNNEFSKNIALIDGEINLSVESCLSIHGASNFQFLDNRMSPIVFIVNSNFYSNTNLMFTNNTSPSGIALFDNSSLILGGRSEFTGNNVCFFGALALSTTPALFLGEISFSNNFAGGFSAGLYLNSTIVRVNGDIYFTSNSAYQVTSLFILGSVMYIEGTLTNNNNGYPDLPETFSNEVSTLGIWLEASGFEINGGAEFRNNLIYYSVIYLADSSILNILMNTDFVNNKAINLFSCVSVFDGGQVQFSNATFSDNSGVHSVIFIENSLVTLLGNTMFFQNLIMGDLPEAILGGAIGLFSSTLVAEGEIVFEKNEVNGYGGAIFTSNSTVSFNGTATFQNNTARYGGAIYVVSSTVNLDPHSLLVFENNSAIQGGAVYVRDIVNFDSCTVNSRITNTNVNPSCFVSFDSSTNDVIFRFLDNRATDGGSVLYGGRLDVCHLPNQAPFQSAFDIFKKVIEFGGGNTLPQISSDPLVLCFCTNSDVDCNNLSTPIIRTRRGQRFSISVTTKSQTGTSIPATIRTLLAQSEKIAQSLDGNLQRIQNMCTELHYRLFSDNDQERIGLYVDGPCRDIGVVRFVQIELDDCPLGFSHNSSRCVCDDRIKEFTDECNIDTGEITKVKNLWMGSHKNKSNKTNLLRGICPLGYCIPAPSVFDLSSPDSQCMNNRSGVLCGSCEGNLSLILGSLKCEDCSNKNSHLSFLLLFALFGILLVAFLFLLQITIASGTIHGLILYANFINSNLSVFSPPGTFVVLKVFLAWLNLDFGIEECFHHGLNQSAKSGWQFAFPIYLLVLVGLIILLAECSSKVSNFFGKGKPVEVLATIILLSVNKLLQNIISIFAVGIVYKSENNQIHKIAWLFDGNVYYGQNEHLVLLIFACIVLLCGFLPYAFVLLTAQCLQKFDKLGSFYNKVEPFLKAYQSNYKSKHRYWTGALLFARVYLFLINVSTMDRNFSLLSLTTICIALLSIIGLARGIYDTRWMDVLEVSFILNFGILSAVKLYYFDLNGGYHTTQQVVVSNISLSIVFVTFIGIVFYHIFKQLMKIERFENFVCEKKDKVKSKVTTMLKRNKEGQENAEQLGQTRRGHTVQVISTLTRSNRLRESLVADQQYRLHAVNQGANQNGN